MKKSEELFHKMSGLDSGNSKVDMHIHTTWTDGKGSLSEMVRQAEGNSLVEIAVTDHIRKESVYYPDYIRELAKIREVSRISIFSGFEAKIENFGGDVDIPDNARVLADIVIASVHRLHYRGDFRYPKEFGKGELAKLERDLALAAAISGKANVIGHSGGMSIATYGSFPIDYFKEIIQCCAKCGVAFEYNYKYHSIYEGQIKGLLTRYDPFVSVGSDAHETAKVARRGFIR